MADLIYKDTAKRIIDSPRNKIQMLAVLEQTPPVEIIMCKNCKHHNDECLWCKKLQRETDNDCYCSLAKRRNCND